MWFHHCNDAACCPGDRSTSDIPSRKRGRLTIDLHCHALVPAVEALVAGLPQKAAEPDIMVQDDGRGLGGPQQRQDAADRRPAHDAHRTAAGRHGRHGRGRPAGQPVADPVLLLGRARAGPADRAAQNEAIADSAPATPSAWPGWARWHCSTRSSPPSSWICSQDAGPQRRRDLDLGERQGARRPVTARLLGPAEALGALVFIHPFGTTLGTRTATHYLVNTIGQPLETTIALSRLIFGGVLDAQPGLKIVAAHGGGYLPTYIGRSDHAQAVRPEAAADAGQPSEYLKRIWFDTRGVRPDGLAHLIDRGRRRAGGGRHRLSVRHGPLRHACAGRRHARAQ